MCFWNQNPYLDNKDREIKDRKKDSFFLCGGVRERERERVWIQAACTGNEYDDLQGTVSDEVRMSVKTSCSGR